jgi:hypothetical protein
MQQWATVTRGDRQQPLNGTYLCQPYSYDQMAYGNNWNGTAGVALTSAEYAITSCGGNLVFEDPFSSEEVTCGQAVPPCPDPPCMEVPDSFSSPPTWDAFADCPTCREVATSWADSVALNVACLDAMSMGNDTVPGNELEAIARWAEILLSDLDTLNASEVYLIQYGHALLKESYSDAFAKGQLLRDSTDVVTNDHLALVDDVLSLRIASSAADSLYHRRLYASVDRAQAYRMAGYFGTAVVLLDSILAWVDTGEVELVARIACLSRIERNLADSTLHWDELEEAMALCDPAALMVMYSGPVGATSSKAVPPTPTPPASFCSPGIVPNPVLDEAWINGIGDEPTLVQITDLGGRIAWQNTIQGAVKLQADLLRPGLYTYAMSNSRGGFCIGKLVIAH